MAKITHYDAETFVPRKVKFDDLQIKLAKEIRELIIESKPNLPKNEIILITNVITNDDKDHKDLRIGIMRYKQNGDKIIKRTRKKFRIIIEKIREDGRNEKAKD